MGCTNSNELLMNIQAKVSRMKTNHNINDELPSNYKIGSNLGSGAYSTVVSAINNEDHTNVAVKIIKKRKLAHKQWLSVYQEVTILKKLNHDNIMKIVDFYEGSNAFYIVLENLKGGTLYDKIKVKNGCSEKNSRDVSFAILMALKYLHDQNIVHRDIKPTNILLSAKTGLTAVKIADFGFSSYCDGLNLTSFYGTPHYVAPEILNRIPYGKPCDMWSFGVLLYQLICGTLPFYSDQQIELYSIICKGNFSFNSIDWSDISRDAKSLIKGLLTVDQSRRLTIDQAISHPWFSKNDQLKKYQERHERKFTTVVASKE